MKKILLGLLAVLAVAALVACESKEKLEVKPEVKSGESEVVASGEETPVVPKDQQIGTAGSNIPLKDNFTEAELEIKRAVMDLIRESYGDNVYDARVNVTKMYTYEDEQQVPALKEMNLTANEVAFEVSCELKPSVSGDVNLLTIGSGVYDEETGWVTEKYNVGVLKLNPSGDEPKYIIDGFGTGW